MGLEQLKEEVYRANLELVKRNLVISTWGNVSGYDEESGCMVIKASGVHYDEMTAEHMVVVDMDGNVVDSKYRPSSDTNTHLQLYKAFLPHGIKGIVHTHSNYATTWAQMGQNIPCLGTTHCDYFFGDIPCTRLMTPEEIASDYETNTGHVIIESFQTRSCVEMQAVLVHSHAPFTWGKTPMDAVLHSQVLERVAEMALHCLRFTNGQCPTVQKELVEKHYNRKFGPNAYYGQEK